MKHLPGSLPPATRSARAARLRALLQQGLQHQQAQRWTDAAACYHQALRSEPASFDALQLLGALRFRSGDPEAGIALLQRALSLQPQHAPTLNNLGNALRATGRLGEAIVAYEAALRHGGAHPLVLRNLGSALLDSGDRAGAAHYLGQSLALHEADPELHCWLGHLARASGRPEDAARAYRRSLTLDPSLAQAYRGLGSALRDLGARQEAHGAYGRALQLQPGLLSVRLLRLNLALSLCSWEEWEQESQQVCSAAPTAATAADPFTLFFVTESPTIQRRFADAFAAHVHATAPQRPAIGRHVPAQNSRIRVAYVSSDIREHPVARLTAGLFAAHDRSRVDVGVYALGADDGSAIRRRIASQCERFVALDSVADREIAARLQADRNDIVVDLSGYTEEARPRALAGRPAPVIVNWLGYAGTMGKGLADYIVADEFVVPRESQCHYAEQVVWLPDSFLPNDRNRPVNAPLPRAAYDLPESGLILCSFNQAQKINPRVFGVWMDILRSIPDAVLWLSVRDELAITNLRREAERRGIEARRLIVAPRVADNADHLARYRVADLALDTFPYASHATASDALWAGCPLVAWVGQTFASRVAGSALRAAGLPELVTGDERAYRELILALATNRQRLTSLRRHLDDTRETCPLFDTAQLTRALEAAYGVMHQRVLAGQPASPIHIGEEI